MSVPVYSKNKRGGELLTLEGYEYLRVHGKDNRWRCRLKERCNARLEMSDELATLHTHHSHEPVEHIEQNEQEHSEPAVHIEESPSPPSVVETEENERQTPEKPSEKSVHPGDSLEKEWEYPEPEPVIKPAASNGKSKTGGNQRAMSAVSMNGIVKKKTVNKSVKKKKRPTAMKGKAKKPTATKEKAKKPILAQLMAKKTVNGLGERDRTGRFTGTGSAKKSEKAPAPRASTAAPKSFPPALRVPRVASSPPPPAKSPHPGIALPFPKVAVPYPNMLENSGFMGTVGVEAGEKFGQYVTAMLNTLRPERKRKYMKAIRRTIAELDLQAADQDSDVEMV